MIENLYVAWQDEATRRWYPIGCLSTADPGYRFRYTRGSLTARVEAGFAGLPSFPDPDRIYRSDRLFAVFANRLLSRSRPEYLDFVRWMDLSESEGKPLDLLARSAGRRVTDNLVVFPRPERDEEDQCTFRFFPHGMRHVPEASRARALEIRAGEPLLLFHDLQNPKDPYALGLRTFEKGSGDGFLLGYVPRYLVDEIWKLIHRTPDLHQRKAVVAEQVNLPPALLQYRLLCRLSLPWPEGYEPFAGEAFEPIVSCETADQHALPR